MISFSTSQTAVSDMPADIVERARERAQVCSVFGNPSRVLILWALGERELSVGDISSAIECSLQSTSQHLHLMKDRGILTSRRDGHTIYYRVNYDERLADCGLVQLARAVSVTKE
jgi:DNA-binding transcriptional ArsR family regulator